MRLSLSALLDRLLAPPRDPARTRWMAERPYAHRGLYGFGVIENSRAAFEAAWARHRDGRLTAQEAGLVAGCLVLVAGFVASLPLISAGVPIAVQLQTSRAFWPVEIVATLFLVWWLVDRASGGSAGRSAARLIAAVDETKKDRT